MYTLESWPEEQGRGEEEGMNAFPCVRHCSSLFVDMDVVVVSNAARTVQW